MKHRWYTPKGLPSMHVCRICGATLGVVDADSACEIARHPDPTINALYRARRKAAEKADGSGWSAVNGWSELNALTADLTKLDPEGDWYFESNRYDGRGWRVQRGAA